MPNNPNKYGYFLVLLFCLPGIVLAQETTDSTDQAIELDFSLELNSIKNNLAWVGQNVDKVAHYIDDFFAEEQKIKKGQTRLSVSLSNRISEKKVAESKLGFNLVANLPKTENKLNVYIESFSQPDENLEQSSTYKRTIGEKQNFLGLGVMYQLSETLNIKTRAGLGVKNDQLNPHAALSLPFHQPLTDRWSLAFEPEVFWYRVEETGQRAYVNFNYRHASNHHFRSTSSAIHYDLESYSNLAQTLQWQHRLDDYNIITYKTGRSWQWQNRLQHQDSYIEIAWRNRFYENWLFVTLTPGIHAPIDLNHQTNAYFIVSFEAYSYNR